MRELLILARCKEVSSATLECKEVPRRQSHCLEFECEQKLNHEYGKIGIRKSSQAITTVAVKELRKKQWLEVTLLRIMGLIPTQWASAYILVGGR
jgi:hypothetical protein